REEILPALDRLSQRLRRELGESLDSIEGARLALAEATTSSVEALQLFTEGKALMAQGRVEEARDLYARALELDSEFARAYAALATTYRGFGITYDSVLAEKYFQEAMRRLDRVGERERLEIQGVYYGVMGRYEESARFYRLLVDRYPTVDEYHTNLARQYAGLSRHEESIREFEEAIRLNPRSAGTLVNLASAYGTQGQFSQQIGYLEQAFALEPEWETDEIQNHQYGWALLLDGDEQGARRAFEKMLAQGGAKKARGHRSLGILALYRGQLKEAAAQLEQAARVDEGAGALDSSARDLLYLAEGQALSGLNQEALRRLGNAVSLLQRSGYQPAWLGFRTAVIYARLGESAEAARLMAVIPKEGLSENRMDGVDALRAEGELLLARGATDEGVEILRRCHASWPSELTRASLARALMQSTGREEALERYREIVGRAPLPWEGQVEWVLAHVTLGRLYEDAGRENEARAAYVKFLELWKDADPELPLLMDVRRRLGTRIELR
ncbi:MAG TPA: tetratricopeptide repeat protein, partial [Vicinamibacteria bacterium]|nr:tetratricopeptide repeat protein [Vicinamibacteria bacterium]